MALASPSRSVAGSATGDIAVGPLRLSFDLEATLEPALAALLSGYHARPDALQAASAMHVNLRLEIGRMRGDEPRQPRLVADEGGALSGACEAWHARLEPSDTGLRATFRLRDPSTLPDGLLARWQPIVLAAGLASALRVTLAVAAPRAGGLLLHAAALVAPSGRAAIFTGPSGAGKTTMTRRLHPWRSLADDAALVFPGTSGWQVSGTPLRGSEDLPRRAESAPVTGVFHLRKDAGPELTRMGEAQAFASLLSRVFWFSAPDARLADIAQALVAEVPSHTLASRLEDDVAGLLDGAA